MIYRYAIILLISLVSSASYAKTCIDRNNENSEESTIVIYYANGVGNIITDAIRSLEYICNEYENILSSQFGDEVFEFRFSYNPTENYIADSLEAFDQKTLEELGLTTTQFIKILQLSALSREQALERKFQERLDGLASQNPITGPGSTTNDPNQPIDLPALRRKFAAQVELYNSYIATRISSLETEENIVKSHSQMYLNSLSEGKKILIIAHSQGNLFTNRALDIIYSDPSNDVYRDSIAYISVATPASKVSGEFEYITAHDDLIINASRGRSINPVLDSNTNNEYRATIDLPYLSDALHFAGEVSLLGGRDITNHSFVNSYLDPIYENLASRIKLDVLVRSLINSLIESRIQDSNGNGVPDFLEPPISEDPVCIAPRNADAECPEDEQNEPLVDSDNDGILSNDDSNDSDPCTPSVANNACRSEGEVSSISIEPLIPVVGQNLTITAFGRRLPDNTFLELEENGFCEHIGDRATNQQRFVCRSITSSKDVLGVTVGWGEGVQLHANPFMIPVDRFLPEPEPEVDGDNDGLLASNDPNDADACIPSVTNNACRSQGVVNGVSINPSPAIVGQNVTITVNGTRLPDNTVLGLEQNSFCEHFGTRSPDQQRFICRSITSSKESLEVTIGWSGGEELQNSPFLIPVDTLLPESEPEPEPEPVASVTDVNPKTATVGEYVEFDVAGENLSGVFAVSLNGTSNCRVTSRADRELVIGCTPELSGTRELYLALESGGPPIQGSPISIQVDEADSFDPTPIVFSVTPLEATVGVPVEFEITGRDLPHIEIYLDGGICDRTNNSPPDEVSIGREPESNRQVFFISCTPEEGGEKQLRVVNDDSGKVIEGGSWTINVSSSSELIPVILGISPDSIPAQKQSTVLVSGENLPNDIFVNSLASNTECEITALVSNQITMSCYSEGHPDRTTINRPAFFWEKPSGNVLIQGSEQFSFSVEPSGVQELSPEGINLDYEITYTDNSIPQIKFSGNIINNNDGRVDIFAVYSSSRDINGISGCNIITALVDYFEGVCVMRNNGHHDFVDIRVMFGNRSEDTFADFYLENVTF